MQRAGLFLLTIFLLAVSARAYRVEWSPHRFADCNAALLFALDHPTVGAYQYRLRGHLDRAVIQSVPSLGFRATARVTYSLDPKLSVMKLPRWTWNGMTPAQRAGLDDFLATLTNHEEGHREIAERALSRTSSITVIASTRAGARRDLLNALANQLHEQYAETMQAEKTYDRVTAHGVRQSEGPTYGYRGGPAVTFGCR